MRLMRVLVGPMTSMLHDGRREDAVRVEDLAIGVHSRGRQTLGLWLLMCFSVPISGYILELSCTCSRSQSIGGLSMDLCEPFLAGACHNPGLNSMLTSASSMLLYLTSPRRI